MHSIGVGLANSGKGDVTVYDERTFSFLDLCEESGGAFVDVESEDMGRGEGDRRRFSRALVRITDASADGCRQR